MGLVTRNWPIDKLIAIPPTSGIAPVRNFLACGLSTQPTAFATFRIKKSDEKEKKPTNDNSNNMMNSSQYFILFLNACTLRETDSHVHLVDYVLFNK